MTFNGRMFRPCALIASVKAASTSFEVWCRGSRFHHLNSQVYAGRSPPPAAPLEAQPERAGTHMKVPK